MGTQPDHGQHAGRTARARNRRGHGGQLRTEIIAAVNRLLDAWGSVDKLTIRAVAAEVGVAAPSVYLHFSDKAELVWAALSDKYEQLASELRAADATVRPGDALARLRAQVHAYCRFGLDNPGHYRLMYETPQPPVEVSRLRRHPASAVSGSLRAATARCRETGCALALPTEQTAHTLWVGLHGAVSLTHSLFPSTSVQPLIFSLADGLLDSLVAPPGEDFHDKSCAPEGDAVRHLRAVLDGAGGDHAGSDIPDCGPGD